MTIEIIPLITLILMHFVADFVFQTHAMATNKSTSNKWLASHVAVYTIPFFWFGWQFAIINGIAHFCTDWVSSRTNSYFWKKGDVHNFFVSVGADQAIHMITLVLTYYWLVA